MQFAHFGVRLLDLAEVGLRYRCWKKLIWQQKGQDRVLTPVLIK